MRQFVDLTFALALLAGLTMLALHLGGDRQERLAGPARAIDGDTLAFGETRVRLKGIDAPELAQTCRRKGVSIPCGLAARAALRGMLAPDLVCEGEGHDMYGRVLARCRTAQGDLAERLVEAGLAVSLGCCRSAEERARAAGRGLWAGTFDMPANWRKTHANSST